jgi:dihydrolipoamide dehydrogenase
VVEYLDQILPGMDEEVRKESAKIFKKQGFEFRTGTKVTGATVDGGKATLTVEPAKGGEASTIEADAVLVAIGRRPNVDGLALDKAGLALNPRGQIDTDHDFRTTVQASGQSATASPARCSPTRPRTKALPPPKISPGQTGIVNHAVIPSVVYTHPEIAGVGLSEEQAKQAGHEIKVGKFPFMANSRAKTNRDTDGFVKVIADAKNDRVLGVWIISSLAGTLIAEACVAMEFGATSEDIALYLPRAPDPCRGAQGSGNGGPG